MCDWRGMFCKEIVWGGHLLPMFTYGVASQVPRTQDQICYKNSS